MVGFHNNNDFVKEESIDDKHRQELPKLHNNNTIKGRIEEDIKDEDMI